MELVLLAQMRGGWTKPITHQFNTPDRRRALECDQGMRFEMHACAGRSLKVRRTVDFFYLRLVVDTVTRPPAFLTHDVPYLRLPAALLDTTY